MDSKRQLPIIEAREILLDDQGIKLEQQQLLFSNGERRLFRRTIGQGQGAVLAIPITENFEALLIKEYCAGQGNYEWALPKGHINEGEEATVAAVRESREETGYGANKVTFLKSVSLSPSYMTHLTHLVLLQDLYHAPLPGDEPEQPEVFHYPLSDLAALVQRSDVTEARSLFALYYVRELLLSGH